MSRVRGFGSNNRSASPPTPPSLSNIIISSAIYFSEEYNKTRKELDLVQQAHVESTNELYSVVKSVNPITIQLRELLVLKMRRVKNLNH